MENLVTEPPTETTYAENFIGKTLIQVYDRNDRLVVERISRQVLRLPTEAKLDTAADVQSVMTESCAQKLRLEQYIRDPIHHPKIFRVYIKVLHAIVPKSQFPQPAEHPQSNRPAWIHFHNFVRKRLHFPAEVDSNALDHLIAASDASKPLYRVGTLKLRWMPLDFDRRVWREWEVPVIRAKRSIGADWIIGNRSGLLMLQR